LLSGLTVPSSPAAGFRSITTLVPKRHKSGATLKTTRGQAVGCNELLAAILKIKQGADKCLGLWRLAHVLRRRRQFVGLETRSGDDGFQKFRLFGIAFDSRLQHPEQFE